MVPRALVPKVLEMLHNGPSGGYLRVMKTLHKVRERFYWPCLKDDVELWCRQCKESSQRKSPSKRPRAPTMPVRTEFPMERIAMDILGPLSFSHRGNKYVLVVTDYFTRWSEAHPLPNQEAITVARILVDETICRFVVPWFLHSHQGANFESKLVKEVCELLGVEKTRTTPYHPQSDGVV